MIIVAYSIITSKNYSEWDKGTVHLSYRDRGTVHLSCCFGTQNIHKPEIIRVLAGEGYSFTVPPLRLDSPETIELMSGGGGGAGAGAGAGAVRGGCPFDEPPTQLYLS